MLNREDALKDTRRRPKALALLSGGLDSMLAVKVVLDQRVDVEAVNFTTPFCLCDRCSVNKFVKELTIEVHRIFLGQEFLDIVADPPHGRGSQMNPCIDCRILMFKKAKEIAENIEADFLVTGEVLDERPFSQRRGTMFLIEREAGLEGKILRPLSAKLLPESEPEKRGWVDRDRLMTIRGRRRLPQMGLARELGMDDYPNPSGGCLLTDPRFGQRLKEHLEHEGKLTLKDIALLKIGRHFRLDVAKIIVGRNEGENERLLAIAKSRETPYLEVVDYEGPVALYIGEEKPDSVQKAAAITIRYSDAPKDIPVNVVYRRNKKEETIQIEAIRDNELERLRI